MPSTRRSSRRSNPWSPTDRSVSAASPRPGSRVHVAASPAPAAIPHRSPRSRAELGGRYPALHSGEWRNWQTRRLQVPVSERMWGFKSPSPTSWWDSSQAPRQDGRARSAGSVGHEVGRFAIRSSFVLMMPLPEGSAHLKTPAGSRGSARGAGLELRDCRPQRTTSWSCSMSQSHTSSDPIPLVVSSRFSRKGLGGCRTRRIGAESVPSVTRSEHREPQSACMPAT